MTFLKYFGVYPIVCREVSIWFRYRVEVVTSSTMQKEMMQSVKFSIGTWLGSQDAAFPWEGS